MALSTSLAFVQPPPVLAGPAFLAPASVAIASRSWQQQQRSRNAGRARAAWGVLSMAESESSSEMPEATKRLLAQAAKVREEVRFQMHSCMQTSYDNSVTEPSGSCLYGVVPQASTTVLSRLDNVDFVAYEGEYSFNPSLAGYRAHEQTTSRTQAEKTRWFFCSMIAFIMSYSKLSRNPLTW